MLRELKNPFTAMAAVKDDPDFSISLGADGITRKLEIEKSVTDVAEINGDYVIANITLNSCYRRM